MNLIKSETTKKIASNTIYQLTGKFISMTITVIGVMIISRVYGREGFGEFSLMQTWPALVFIVVDFGINAIATKDISKDWSLAGKYLGNILLIRVLMSIILMVVLGAAMAVFPYNPALIFGIRLSLFLILTQALYASLNIIFQSKLRYDLSILGYIFGYLFILGAIVGLSFFKVNVIWVNFSYVIGGFITFFVNYFLILKLGVKPDFKIDKNLWGYVIIQSLPLGLMFVFSQLNFKSDSLMLSVLSLPGEYGLNNTETVAVYNLPYKVFEVSLVLPTFFMNSVYPVFVRHSLESQKKLRDTFFYTVKVLAGLGLVSAVFGVVFSKYVINILGGNEFVQSVLVLQILLGGLIIYFLSAPLSWLIVVLEKQVYLPWIYLVNAVFNISANLIFIPKYSFYAAAVITHISELAILVLLVYAAKKAWKLKYA